MQQSPPQLPAPPKENVGQHQRNGKSLLEEQIWLKGPSEGDWKGAHACNYQATHIFGFSLSPFPSPHLNLEEFTTVG